MDTKVRSQTAAMVENHPEQTHAAKVIQAAPPMPAIKPPPVIWTTPSFIPGHDTEIRHWGINE
jgi:hypothetical protein